MDKRVYKTEVRKFFNEEGRFIDANGYSWLVLKDMFNWLGRLTTNGQIETTDRRKLDEFLQDIDKESASESFTITSKGRKQSRETQEVNCIRIDVIPMVLTQFKPTKRAGEERLNQWRELMKFINAILMELEVYKFITEDKNYQKKAMKRLQRLLPQELNNPKSYQKINIDVAYILQELGDTSVPIFKPMIQSQICNDTIDVLELREEVLDVYLNMYELFEDFDSAKINTIQIMKNRYL